MGSRCSPAARQRSSQHSTAIRGTTGRTDPGLGARRTITRFVRPGTVRVEAGARDLRPRGQTERWWRTATVLRRHGDLPLPVQTPRGHPLLSHGTPLHAIFECATALERAEASSRVLAARAAGHAGAPRAFAELAAIAPEGLIPTPGRGAAHVASQIERAADIAVEASELLGADVIEALEWAAGMTQRLAASADALDPAGAARAARRGVATVRGLVDGTIDRDERWDAFRLGTFMPRAAWVSALIRAAATVSAQNGRDDAWRVAGALTGLGPDGANIAHRLMTDRDAVTTAAHALDRTEASLLSLQRRSAVGTAALPLAREAHARLRDADRTLPQMDDAAHAMDRVLDAIGALAGAMDPRVSEPGHPPMPGLRRPLASAGTIV